MTETSEIHDRLDLKRSKTAASPITCCDGRATDFHFSLWPKTDSSEHEATVFA